MRRIFILLPALLALQVGVSPALAWTWPVDGPVLQTFSLGSDPYEGGQHRGIDVGAPAGASVAAPASGTVVFAGTLPTYGRSVTIETSDGYTVTLVHLGASSVTEGAAIGEGDQVGAVGPSGEPELAEPYVHLGIRVATDPNGYVDPLLFLPPPDSGERDPVAPAEESSGETQTEAPAAATGEGDAQVDGAQSPAVTTTLEPPDTPAPEPPVPVEPVAAAEAVTVDTAAPAVEVAAAPGVESPPRRDRPSAATSRSTRPRAALVPLATPPTPAPPVRHVRHRPWIRQSRQAGPVRSIEPAPPPANAKSVRVRPVVDRTRLEHARPPANAKSVRVGPVVNTTRLEHAAPSPARPSAPPVHTRRGRRPPATTPLERTQTGAGTRLAPAPSVSATERVAGVLRPRLRQEDVRPSRRSSLEPRRHAHHPFVAAVRNGAAPERRSSTLKTAKALQPATGSTVASAASSDEAFSAWLAALAGAGGMALVLLCLRRRRPGAPAAPKPPPAPRLPDARRAPTEVRGSVAESLDRELALILAQAGSGESDPADNGSRAAARASEKAWWQVE